MTYCGLFDDIAQLNLPGLEEIDLYESFFAEKYEDILGSYAQELEIYRRHALRAKGLVLELACGTGRIMIDLAKQGIQIHGIDCAQDMLDQLAMRLESCSVRVRKNITFANANVFQYRTKPQYGLVILPATTICLLSDDERKTRQLFQNIYDMLIPGGRFIFDYRADQSPNLKEASPLGIQTYTGLNCKEIIFFQEFDNYIPGRSIVNFYAEIVEGAHTQRYMTSSSKKIITRDFLQGIIEQTPFEIQDEEVIKLSDTIHIEYLSLEKPELTF